MASVILTRMGFFIPGIFSLGIGLFLFFKPEKVIEFQRCFYLKINWKIEPVSMEKEVRNTRMMGAFLLFMIVLFFTYFIFSGLFLGP